jgi:dipeptidase E
VQLYLSSYRIGDDPSVLRDLVAGNRAAVVLNACDVFDDRRHVWPREEADLGALGFDVTELDLREHFGDPAGLAERLRSLDLVWVTGGNTFALARAMHASGFAAAVPTTGLVYAGYSAGACVVTPGFDGIHLMDDPGAVPFGYPPDARPEPLGWVPWRIVPHWRSEHGESPAAELAVEHLLAAGLPFRTLRDGQVIVAERYQPNSE